MAQDKFFQEQFYYQYRTNALKYIDQKTVVQIIAAYKNTELTLDEIMDMFPDAPVSKKLHHNLPYERTKEKCICGGFVYQKVPNRQAKEELLLCPNCGHDQYGRGSHLCECRICSTNRDTALLRVRNKFRSEWNAFHDKEYQHQYSLNELSRDDIHMLIGILSSDYIIERIDANFKIKCIDTIALTFDPVAHEFSIHLNSLIKNKILTPVRKLSLEQIDRLRRDFQYHHFAIAQKNWLTTLRWTINVVDKTALIDHLSNTSCHTGTEQYISNIFFLTYNLIL